MPHGGYDPPDWYGPFVNLQFIADELRCSVMEAAGADPEWQQMARVAVWAKVRAKRRQDETGRLT